MKYSNPCSCCIVRPRCTKKCEDIKKYHNLFTEGVILLLSLISLVLTVVVISVFYSRYSSLHATILSLILVLSGYLYIVYIIVQDINGFKEFKKSERWSTIIFGPWIFAGAFVYGIFDDEIDIFIFRYNYKVNPYIQEVMKNKKEKRQKNARISWSIWSSKGDD